MNTTDIVEYPIYVHGSKESAWEAARDAGFTEDEIKEWGLHYAGYEVMLVVSVDKSTGEWTERIKNE